MRTLRARLWGWLAGSAKRDGWFLFALGFLVRAGVVLWARGQFPPTADARFYQIIAERISQGAGYTWLWPDGVVTFAAHYPVGYPAIVGAFYAVFGPEPSIAMMLNALLGAVCVLAVHRIALHGSSRTPAFAAALLLALHPGLVAYTPALMTEGFTASLLTCGAWATMHAGRHASQSDSSAPNPQVASRRTLFAYVLLSGLLFGAATLVRPQSIVIAPLLAWVSAGGLRRPRVSAWLAAAICALALLTCAPWTARNCVRMKSCALVSVNGGWNLLIGADKASTGSWSPINVPEACREVWDEAAKDACFAREARRYIVSNPVDWLALVPSKLGATFNYCGAAGWYLHASNPQAFSDKAKVALGAAELGYERLLLIAALAALARRRIKPFIPRSWRSLPALVLSGAGILSALTVQAWLGYTALAALSLWPSSPDRPEPFLVRALGVVLAATLLTHAIFFGAGRYSLVVFPLVCGVAALLLQKNLSSTTSGGPPEKS